MIIVAVKKAIALSMLPPPILAGGVEPAMMRWVATNDTFPSRPAASWQRPNV